MVDADQTKTKPSQLPTDDKNLSIILQDVCCFIETFYQTPGNKRVSINQFSFQLLLTVWFVFPRFIDGKLYHKCLGLKISQIELILSLEFI